MIVWNVGQTFSNTREIPARLSQASPLQLIYVLQNGEWVSEWGIRLQWRTQGGTLSLSSSNVSQTLRSHLLGIWWRSVCEEREEIEIFFPSLTFWKVKKRKGGRCLNNSWTHFRYLVVDWEGQFVWFDGVQMFVFGSTHQLPLRPDVPIFHHWLFLLNLFRGRT